MTIKYIGATTQSHNKRLLEAECDPDNVREVKILDFISDWLMRVLEDNEVTIGVPGWFTVRIYDKSEFEIISKIIRLMKKYYVSEMEHHSNEEGEKLLYEIEDLLNSF